MQPMPDFGLRMILDEHTIRSSDFIGCKVFADPHPNLKKRRNVAHELLLMDESVGESWRPAVVQPGVAHRWREE